jgi:oxygen-independent coproporphyrinogen-3 oxidase
MGALSREIAAYKDQCSVHDSLYLGGGTPSVLEDRDVASLFDLLFRNFHFTADAEITFEANPDDVRRDKLELLRGLGVNRISLGAQSLCDDELRTLGRRHTVEEAERAVETIRACGFSNLSLDLMYALPAQSPSRWLSTLKRAIELRPEHLSCYQLTYYEGTPLGRELEAGAIRRPSEEEQRTFFLRSAEALQENGYIHYEISNFARGEGWIARHNRKYWRRVPYLGLGPGAHSFREGKRWWNVSSVTGYCDMLSKGRLPIGGSEKLTDEQQRLESLSLGLRTREGVDLPLLRSWPGAEHVLRRLQSDELVEICENRVVPTTKGYVVADALPLLFL